MSNIQRYDFEQEIIKFLEDEDVDPKKAKFLLKMALLGFDEGFDAGSNKEVEKAPTRELKFKVS